MDLLKEQKEEGAGQSRPGVWQSGRVHTELAQLGKAMTRGHFIVRLHHLWDEDNRDEATLEDLLLDAGKLGLKNATMAYAQLEKLKMEKAQLGWGDWQMSEFPRVRK